MFFGWSFVGILQKITNFRRISHVFSSKMVKMHHVTGYDNFCEFMEKLDSNGKTVYVYFSGSKLDNGESWCIDCVNAWPVVKQELDKVDSDTYFIYVEVGDRSTWKDPKCPFRTDPRTKLLVIPTIKKWDSPQILSGDQCGKASLVSMMLTEDHDD